MRSLRLLRACLVLFTGVSIFTAAVFSAAIAPAEPIPSGDETMPGDAAASEAPLSLNAGVAAAKKSGTPLLVMLTREGCPNCQGLKQQIAAEGTLQFALKSFVVVDVNVDAPEARRWQAKYKKPGDTLPYVYLVTSTGKSLSSSGGPKPPEELQTMLSDGLTQLEALNAKSKKPAKAKTVETSAETDEAVEDEAPRKAPPAVGSTAALKRADSFLSLAKTFAKSKPEKARQYARKVMETAPRSLQAIEANQLLKSLE